MSRLSKPWTGYFAGSADAPLARSPTHDRIIVIRRKDMGTVFGAKSGTSAFGPTSTTEDVLAGVNLQGKRILVTGVSAGLGVETARSLAAHGAHVVGAARDLAKAEGATAQVRKDAAKNGGGFELVALDLSDLK